jgi:hypothetical protein
MLNKESTEYIKMREIHRKKLIREAETGETKLDTLPDTAQSLNGEFEAMYFKSIREFFKNSFSESIIKNIT